MDELLDAFLRAGKGVRRHTKDIKVDAPEPEPPRIIARWPKKKLSVEGRRMLSAAAIKNATLIRAE